MSKRNRQHVQIRPQQSTTLTRPATVEERRARHGNAICLAIPLGEMVPTPFVEHELDTFIHALPYASAVHAHGSYHQNTANQLVNDFLNNKNAALAAQLKNCEYLCFYEHDMVPPPFWLDRVRQYDPKEHHIVGPMYFRRNRQDMRPIPGRWSDPDKRAYRALAYEEVEFMVSRPGFHQVDCCGLGATAISRYMLEQWDPDMVPWFHTPIGPDAKENPALCESHDVYFQRNAQLQGFKVFVDSAVIADHYGWFPYNLHLYRQGWYNTHRVETVKRSLEVVA